VKITNDILYVLNHNYYLKQCPYCKNNVFFKYNFRNNIDYLSIHCSNCNLDMTISGKTGSIGRINILNLVDKWNNRK